MSCLVGRKIVNPHYKKLHPDKHYLLYGHKEDYLIPVDCGVCVNCVNKYKSAWNFRLEQEFKYMSLKELQRVYYVTLTMAPEWYSESRSHLSLLVRRFLERYRKKFKKSIRHFLITERGEDENGEHRIHFHGFFFELDHPELIWQLWAYGFVKVKPLVQKGEIVRNYIGYVTGYITSFVDDVIIDKFDKPMVFCSKKLGIAYAIDAKNVAFHHQNDTLFPLTYSNNYKLRSLPRYLRNKVFTEKERNLMKNDYFRNYDDDVIPDPPYYIGKQVYNDYSAYRKALDEIYNQYLKKYGKKSHGSFSELAGCEPEKI